MSYVIGQPVPWPVPPDWDDGVSERLTFLTDVITAKNGKRQKRRLRQAPRRTFEFDVIADKQARRVADALLMDHGGKYFMLPIWHDGQLLGAALANGASSVPCRTVGVEFVEDGFAMLWLAVNQWQLVSIVDIGSTGLTLGSAANREWPLGTRIYPVRRARLTRQPSETTWTDAVGKRRVVMVIDEPCDWPAELPSFLYRGYPVLEWRPDVGDDLSATFTRDLELIDADTGPVNVYDYPGRSMRSGSLRLVAHGREENTALRSLLYGLAGRWASLWVPTWNTDLVLVASAASNAVAITVEWAGYTVFGRLQSNWRDIRIELDGGAVIYRRITSAVEAGATEVLGINAALGTAIAPAQVRCISFMVLGAGASDAVELQHETDADGLTICELSFIGERHDV